MKYVIITFAILLLVGFMAYYFLSSSNQNQGHSMNLSPQEFAERIEHERGIVIDVRTVDEYRSGHLKIADHQYNLMDGEFESRLESLSKDKTYYLYCRSGNRSGQAARLMKENGFEHVYNIGGFSDLANAGFETE